MRYSTLLAAAVAVLVCLIQASSASAAVNCIYHPEATPKYVAVTLGAAGDNAALERDTFDDQLLVNNNVCIGGGEIADNENTDTVVINDATLNGGTGVRIVHPQAFAPGATPEGQFTDSEIEFELNLGGGNDSLVVQGTDSADTFTFGANGLNVGSNPLDFDPDVTWNSVNDFTVWGGDGDDRIGAHGGRGTGEPLGFPITIHGEANNDHLEGGDVEDALYGDAGADELEGGLGTDYIDGAAGADTVSYAHSPSAVTVALDPAQTGQQTGGEGTDGLHGIEHITGSPFDDRLETRSAGGLKGGEGNDRLIGSNANDDLNAGAGDDVIDPGGEVTVLDIVSGGPGTDTLTYARAPKAVGVDLAAGTGDPRDGVGTGDELIAVESVEGSAFSDQLTGTSNANTIDGGAGSDEVAAGAGDDTIRVRDGENDTADCGDGTDSAVADRRDQDALTACETQDALPDLPPPSEPTTPQDPGTPPTTPEVPRTTPDTTLNFSLSAKRAQRLLKTRALVAKVACADEPCTIKALGTLGKIKLKAVTRSLAGDRRTTVKVPLSRKALSRIRTQLLLHRKPRLKLKVTATDTAGNKVARKSAVTAK